MANINVNGNLKASLTVGNIVGVTDKKLEEALSTKADINHIHEEYLTEHQSLEHLASKDHTHDEYLTEHQDISHLATEEYVNEQIGNIPEVDLSNHVTNEQLIDVLETKANAEHNHDDIYVSQSQYAELSLAVESNSEKISDNEISIINNTRKLSTLATQKLDSDTSYDSLLTNDKTIIGAINEIFEMVRSLISYTITVNYIDIDGNVLQDPYIFTVKLEEEYNVSEIKIDGYFYYYADKDLQGTVIEDTVINIVYIAIGEDGLPLPTSEFYVQYTIDNLIDPEELLSTIVVSPDGREENFYLPSLTSGYNDFTKKEILLKDGSIISDLDIKVKDIERIRLYYNPLETRLRFFGSSVRPHNIKKLEYINTKNFTDMNNMFGFCGNLVGIEGIEDWNTSNVTDMASMFFACNSLTSVDLSNFNTENVTDMDLMFYSCESLTTLDLSSFNTSSVNDMTSMFSHCSSLDSLDLTTWDTSNVTAKENMFLYVPSDVDFNYDGSNYQNWTLTESDTYFAGTFPWNSKPSSSYYTTYSINSNVTSPQTLEEENPEEIVKDETIFFYGSYMPKFDNGYTYVELLLNDGNTTTNLDVPVEEVQQATVWYSGETKNISFTNTKVKDVTYINLENIENLAFTDCTYLESVDLSKTTTTGNCVHEQTFDGVPEECKITISKDWEKTEEQSGFTGTYTNPWKYHIKYTLEKSDYNIEFNNGFYIPKITTDDGSITNSNQDFILLEMYLTDGSIVTEDFESLTCNDIELIIAYYPENTINIKCPERMTSLEYINIDNITDMRWMFNGCSYITRLDLISEWDTSRVTNMDWMFRDSALTSLNLSEWNTDNVTSMYGMFNGCESLTTLDVSGWNLSGVTSLYGMFDGCTSLQLLDLSSWNISNIKNTEMTFNYCTSLTRLDLSTWDTQKIDSSSSMFNELPEEIDWCYDENDPNSYAKWTLTEEQTKFSGTFPWNKQEEEKLTVAKYTFTSTTDTLPTFNEEFTNYTTTDVDNGDGTTTRTISISKTDTLPTSISFEGKTALLSVEELDTSNVTSMNFMFYDCSSLTSLDLSNFNTSIVNSMVGMFSFCSSLTSLDLSNFDTSNVTFMSGMFYNCSLLTSLDLSNFNTSNVNSMDNMFFNCSSLTSLDLSNFDTSNVTFMSSMFTDIYSDVDWCYDENDPNSYANWTLTEEQTGFSGTFPWNKQEEVKTITYTSNMPWDYSDFIIVQDKDTKETIYEGQVDGIRGDNGEILEIPETTKAFSIENTTNGRLFDTIYVDADNTILHFDEYTNAYYFIEPRYPGGLTDRSRGSQVIYTIENKFEYPLSEKYINPNTGDEYYYAFPYIPDFENKLINGSIELIIYYYFENGGHEGPVSLDELSSINCNQVGFISIIESNGYGGTGQLNGIRFGNNSVDAVSIANNILCLEVPEVDDYLFFGCNYLEQINLKSESEYRPVFSDKFAGFGYCENLKILNLGFDKVNYGSFKGTLENLIVFGNSDVVNSIEENSKDISFQGKTIELIHHNELN